MALTDALGSLNRKPDRGADRRVLDEVFDHCLVATLSTVVDDEPWVIPTLVARRGDELLLHGSTGAGALRHAAAGAKVAVSAFILDGIVVAERQFDHSANYRSAVVRGTCHRLDGEEVAGALDAFTDALIPGRAAECPPHTAKELAQTLVLSLPICDGAWIAKQRSGPPGAPELGRWTGVVPVRQVADSAVSTSDQPVPPSIRAFVGGDSASSDHED